MKIWKKAVGAAAAMLLMSQPVLAATTTLMPVLEPDTIVTDEAIMIEEVVDVEWHELTLTGEVTYVDLEGGFYSVAGWRLIVKDTDLAELEGQWVRVTGLPFQGMSIQMVPAIEVNDLTVIDESEALPTPEPSKECLPAGVLPAIVAIEGTKLAFDEQPLLLEDNLLLPLRAVASAAGANVRWISSQRTAIVTLGEQSLHFSPNPEVSMASLEDSKVGTTLHTAELIGNRLLVRADLLAEGLGLKMRYDVAEDTLHFAHSLNQSEPGDEQAEVATLAGAIQDIESGERNRILVEGEMLETGHPNFVWITISPVTAIVVEEDDALRQGNFEEFEVGQTVHVEIVGPMLLSYPAQAGSQLVTIKK